MMIVARSVRSVQTVYPEYEKSEQRAGKTAAS